MSRNKTKKYVVVEINEFAAFEKDTKGEK